MTFDWGSIKEEIKDYCINVFREENIIITNSEDIIEKALLVYKNIIDRKSDQFLLAGYGEKARKALQDVFIVTPGNVLALNGFANTADPFLKLLLLYSGFSYSEIKELTLKPLAEKTGAFGSMIGSLRNVDIDSLKGDTNKLYLLGIAYESRNINTHNAPRWDKSIVFHKLKYLCAFEIYCIIHLLNQLQHFTPDLFQDNDFKSTQSYDYRAYDLLHFGNSAGELKNKILQGFILHCLVDKEKSIVEIREQVASHLNITSKGGCDRAIRRLTESDKIYKNAATNCFAIQDQEKTRIKRLRIDFRTNIQLILNAIKELVKNTCLENCQQEVYEELSKYLESYIESNLVTVLKDEFDFSKNSLFQYIVNKGFNEEDAKVLTKDLISLTKNHQSLLRSVVGKVYTRLVSSDAFPNPMQGYRDVYIDTQIALYLLSMPNSDFPPPDLPLFRICYEFGKIVNENQELILKIAEVYLSEIIYHLKEALRLVDLEDEGVINRDIPTNNVFYKYFINARRDHLLPASINTFAEYMDELFLVTTDVLDKGNMRDILITSVVDSLKDIGVKIEPIDRYSEGELRKERNIFESVLRSNKKIKSQVTLKNDMIVGHYLFMNESIPPSIFVTLDQSFSLFRDSYLDNYNKSGSKSSWILFSPSRLINHLDLLKMKFEPENLSIGLMSFINADNDMKSTQSLFDLIQHITEMNGVDRRGMKRRQKALMVKFYNKELQFVSEEDQPKEDYVISFARKWDQLFERFNRLDKNRKQYLDFLKKDDGFDNLILLIDKYVKDSSLNMDNLYSEVQQLLLTDAAKENVS